VGNASASSREIYVRNYSDPDSYAAANGLLASQVLGRIGSGFHARVVRGDLGRLKFRWGEASMPVTMTGALPPVHAYTFATRPAAPRLLSGWPVPFGTLFHPRPNEEMSGTSESGQPWPFATVALPYEALESAVIAYGGRPPPRDDTDLLRAPPAALARLLGLMEDAARLAASAPAQLADDRPAAALSGSILDALLACLAQDRLAPDRSARRSHDRIVARLRDIAADRPEDVTSLADLCAMLGTAERTLHLACQELLGMGAMQYLRGRRLERAHRTLRAANPHEDTVAEIAMRYGFWELGRFAGTYRSRFGEAPSATLRRLPG
jgi:AraC-like DNA-binding protein